MMMVPILTGMTKEYHTCISIQQLITHIHSCGSNGVFSVLGYPCTFTESLREVISMLFRVTRNFLGKPCEKG